MSPDTAAQRHDSTVDQRPDGKETGTAGADEDRGEPARSDRRRRGPDEPARSGRDAKRRPAEPARHGRMWTYLTLAAAAAFTGAVAVVGVNLFTGAPDAADLADTPEHSVEEFLTALLDEHDAPGARGWMCEDKADRDLSEATAELAAINEETGVDWSNVTETDRSVGQATVTADLSTGSGAVTWTFTLVAEDSDPQWQVCDMAVR